MKLIHIADLHLGKQSHGFSLYEDQKHALFCILSMCREHRADALIIAGDVYDRSVPPAPAMSLLDDFLTSLLDMGVAVFLIAGNHDSPERLQFASRLLERSGLFISAVYDGKLKRITLNDDYGDIHFTLLPYISPAVARAFFPEASIRDHEGAVSAAISDELPSGRNVLITHQYVANKKSDSAGGIDSVPAALFSRFDYVALGHIHARYPLVAHNIRYSGSPLKYAFDDALEEKGALLVELSEKGAVRAQFLPIKPLRDMLEIRGRIDELLSSDADRTAFIHAILTDEEEVPDAMARLSAVFPYMSRISYVRRSGELDIPLYEKDGKSTLEHFNDFFTLQNGRALDEAGIELIKAALIESEGDV